MSETKPKYYIGAPDTCDVCNRRLKNMMYDAAIPGSSWANMCRTCFVSYGCRVGTGQGQEYARQDDGRWLKTGG